MDVFSTNPYTLIRRCALIWAGLVAIMVTACGPETVFLRPALDTPAQHVQNGHLFLSRGKIDAADAEFFRAKKLDHQYAPAYVGLALIQGYRGDVHGGLKILDQARTFAKTPEEINDVNDGYERLKRIRAAD
ncbi:MAG: hypothetical protein CSA23_06820 [Deltaproteobacteria bacterium]|nr:MAG: hypothetical protein CSA23_06820 [Deltaproteobacteria bacterium]